jgi:hypothetical protein
MRKHQDAINKRALYDLMIKNIERLEQVAKVIIDKKPAIEDDLVFLLIRTMSDVSKLYNHQKDLNGSGK